MGLGHDGEGTDMCAEELGIMIMMMVVGRPPNAAGAEGQDTKNSHQAFSDPGVRQYRFVLLVVINYKKPENQQSTEDAAGNFTGEMRTPESACKATEEKNSCGQDAPPTFCC